MDRWPLTFSSSGTDVPIRHVPVHPIQMDNKYEILNMIGKGSYGEVTKCRHTETNQIVAIKNIGFDDKYEGISGSIIREVSLLMELEHDNIVRLLDVRIVGNSVDLIFEYMDTDLHKFIHTRPENELNSHLIKKFLHQILCGISHCHSHQTLHRDMKPSNLLIDLDKSIVKIADFGLAKAVGVPANTHSHKVATLNYRAPEILLGSTEYTAAVDVWAVGCIFAEMVTRKHLFRGASNSNILLEIFRFFGVPNEDTWPGVASLSKYSSAINSKMKSSPALRQNLAEVVTGLEPAGFDLLSRMLCLNPTRRITAYSALDHPYFKDIQNAP